MNEPVTFSLVPAEVASVEAGHPWLFKGSFAAPPAGTVLSLIGPRGDVVGWGLADRGAIAVRVLGRTAPEPLERTVRDRIRRADALRARLVGPRTDAYRVLAGPGDGVPGLVVDRYAELAVLRVYSEAWEPHLEWVVGEVARLPWVSTVYRRFGVTRVDGRQGGETLAGPDPADTLIVEEAAVRVLVRPYVGQKTGLFLDQREHRHMVGRWAAGRNVVNLFSYTGGFSVTAALGGAAQVTTVDLAPEAIEDARENFRLNDLDPDAHRFEVADAFDWQPRGRPDLVIVDPPSLAHDRRSEGAARAAYRKLHRRVGPWIPRDGLLASSSCTSRLPADGWRRAVTEGLLPSGDWSWHWVSAEPPDHPVSLGHPEGRYLKFGLLRRR